MMHRKQWLTCNVVIQFCVHFQPAVIYVNMQFSLISNSLKILLCQERVEIFFPNDVIKNSESRAGVLI